MLKTKNIPVVITSMIEEKEMALSLGAVDYFAKPVERGRFLKRIADLGVNIGDEVLIVDNNPTDVHRMTSILELEGIRTLYACASEEGVRKAKENKPALIILDILCLVKVISREQTDGARVRKAELPQQC